MLCSFQTCRCRLNAVPPPPPPPNACPQLSGSLSPAIGWLSHLQELDMRSNALTGERQECLPCLTLFDQFDLVAGAELPLCLCLLLPPPAR